MGHPDEGTIHAWLDGALAPDESLTVEAHITVCEACASEVAEARGYVAAASRILSALDHVPGGVTPSVAVTASGIAEIRQAEWQRKRQVRQVFAAAATMLLMVSGGMFVLTRTAPVVSGRADTTALAERIAETASRDAAALDSAPVPVAPTVQASAPAAATEAHGTPVASGGGAGTDAARNEGARADVAATIAAMPAPRPVPPPATAAAFGATARRSTADASFRQRVRSDSMVADSATVDRPARPVAEVANVAPMIPPLSGCYQLVSTTDLSVADSRRDNAAVVASLPSRLRLTDSLVFDRNGERRFLARSIIPGGTPIRRFAWSVSAGGTLRLFVGDSANAPVVDAAVDSATQPNASARLQRVTCV